MNEWTINCKNLEQVAEAISALQYHGIEGNVHQDGPNWVINITK